MNLQSLEVTFSGGFHSLMSEETIMTLSPHSSLWRFSSLSYKSNTFYPTLSVYIYPPFFSLSLKHSYTLTKGICLSVSHSLILCPLPCAPLRLTC